MRISDWSSDVCSSDLGIMRHYLAAALLCAAVGGFGAASAQTTGATQTTPSLPEDLNVLFWSQDQRDAAFRTMETIPKVVVHTIEAGGSAFPLAEGKPIDLGVDVDAYMAEKRTAGIIIIQAGQIRLEDRKSNILKSSN